MFHKTITLSIFALLLAVASCRPQVDVNECSGRENGLYANELDSNAFFVCLDDQLIVHSKCDPGEVFDAELKACSGGSEDQDLTTYSEEGEADDYLGSDVSNLLDETQESEQDERFFNIRTTQKPPSTTQRPPSGPPSRPPPPPPPHFPFPPPPHFPFPPHFPYKNKIVNVRVTENIFPKSILVIGRANTEQKNK